MTTIVNQILFRSTYECNLRCRYCYLAYARQKARTTDWRYVTDSARKLVDKFKEEDYLLRSVLYHGAETMMVPAKTLAETCNIFHEIAPKSEDEYSHQTVQTNGTLLVPEYVSEFEDNLKEDVHFTFSISLDGPRAVTDKYRNKGTYDRAMDNARYLKKRGYFVNLYGCLTPEMFADLPTLEKWIREIDEEGFMWRFQIACEPYMITDEQQIELAHWLHERNWIERFNNLYPDMCSSDGNDCLIYHFDASGAFLPCDRSEIKNVNMSWFDKKISEILEWRKGYFKNYPTSKKCDYCPVKPICNSGCPLFRTEDKRAVDCRLRRTLYELEAKRLNVPMRTSIRMFTPAEGYRRPTIIPMSIGEIKTKNGR